MWLLICTAVWVPGDSRLPLAALLGEVCLIWSCGQCRGCLLLCPVFCPHHQESVKGGSDPLLGPSSSATTQTILPHPQASQATAQGAWSVPRWPCLQSLVFWAQAPCFSSSLCMMSEDVTPADRVGFISVWIKRTSAWKKNKRLPPKCEKQVRTGTLLKGLTQAAPLLPYSTWWSEVTW